MDGVLRSTLPAQHYFEKGYLYPAHSQKNQTRGREKAFLFTKFYPKSALEATISFIFILNSIKMHTCYLDSTAAAPRGLAAAFKTLLRACPSLIQAMSVFRKPTRAIWLAVGPAPEVPYITAYVCISPAFAISPHTFPNVRVRFKTAERTSSVISIQRNVRQPRKQGPTSSKWVYCTFVRRIHFYSSLHWCDQSKHTTGETDAFKTGSHFTCGVLEKLRGREAVLTAAGCIP